MVGDFEEVAAYCVEFLCYPTLLMYSKTSNDAAKEC